MRIEATTSGTGPLRTTAPEPNPDKVAGRLGDSTSPTVESDSFEPTSELARLLQSVRNLPDVRDDVVFDVKMRLLSGELDGQDASAAAAQSIVAPQG